MKVKVFLLIGLTKSGLHWDKRFVAGLKEAFGTDDVFPMDIPGCGERNHLSTPFGVPAIVEDMREHYEQSLLRDDDDTHHLLVSVSLGGMLATEWTRRYPEDFDSLVVINSSFKGFSPVWRRVQPWAMQMMLRIFLTRDSAQKEHLVTVLCGNNPEQRDEILEDWIDIDRRHPLRRRNVVVQTLSGAAYRPDHVPDVPKLILAARHDRLAHYSCSEAIHRAWGGDLVVWDDPLIGHGAHFDAPGRLVEEVRRWWQEKVPGAAASSAAA